MIGVVVRYGQDPKPVVAQILREIHGISIVIGPTCIKDEEYKALQKCFKKEEV